MIGRQRLMRRRIQTMNSSLRTRAKLQIIINNALLLTDSHGKSLLGLPERLTPSLAEPVAIFHIRYRIRAFRVINAYIIGLCVVCFDYVMNLKSFT